MQITIEVPHDKIQSAFISCFEGGYSPWLATFHDNIQIASPPDLIKSDNQKEPGLVWWGAGHMFDGDYMFVLCFDREQDEEGTRRGKQTITPVEVKQGLEIMASRYTKHFGDLINDHGDAITGDVFVQCIIFGKVIYG